VDVVSSPTGPGLKRNAAATNDFSACLALETFFHTVKMGQLSQSVQVSGPPHWGENKVIGVPHPKLWEACSPCRWLTDADASSLYYSQLLELSHQSAAGDCCW